VVVACALTTRTAIINTNAINTFFIINKIFGLKTQKPSGSFCLK
jgi:hypothetical protein